jgi:ketosteroid isomerase-like protein
VVTLDSESNSSAENKLPAEQSDASVDEFFNQLQSDMRRPDVSQEAITAAFNAIQQLALESDSEEAASAVAGNEGAAISCPACGAGNPAENRFCAACGVSLQPPSELDQVAPAARPAHSVAPAAGLHHYHHHYHHHYFAPGQGIPAQGMPPGLAAASPQALVPSAPARLRTPAGGSGLSRAEAAVRRMTQDWAQACNTKHLDDLVDLYATDALVLRPNIAPLRGSAAIREFFFAALDAGLGEVELDPLRVELFGDVAYEAGRCKMLVPLVVGKRREERGKYVMLFVRQPAGDWKTILDSWSSDLSLAVSAEPAAMKPGAMGAPVSSRAPRR